MGLTISYVAYRLAIGNIVWVTESLHDILSSPHADAFDQETWVTSSWLL